MAVVWTRMVAVGVERSGKVGRFAVYLEIRTAGLGKTPDMGMRERELSRIAPEFLALLTR